MIVLKPNGGWLVRVLLLAPRCARKLLELGVCGAVEVCDVAEGDCWFGWLACWLAVSCLADVFEEAGDCGEVVDGDGVAVAAFGAVDAVGFG